MPKATAQTAKKSAAKSISTIAEPPKRGPGRPPKLPKESPLVLPTDLKPSPPTGVVRSAPGSRSVSPGVEVVPEPEPGPSGLVRDLAENFENIVVSSDDEQSSLGESETSADFEMAEANPVDINAQGNDADVGDQAQVGNQVNVGNDANLLQQQFLAFQQMAQQFQQFQQLFMGGNAPQLVGVNLNAPPPDPGGLGPQPVAVQAAPVAQAAHHQPPFKTSMRPPPFDVDKDKDMFLTWKEDWENFLLTSGLESIPDPDRRTRYTYAYLRNALSNNTKKWLEAQRVEEDERKNPNTVIELLERRVLTTANPTQAMVEMLQKEQRRDETISDIEIYINQKDRYCFNGIEDWHDHFKKGAFIKMLHSAETRRKLLAQKDLTFHEAVEFAKNEEKAAKDDKLISCSSSKVESSHVYSTYKPNRGGRGGGQRGRGGHQGQYRGRSQSRGPSGYQRDRSQSGDRSDKKSCNFCTRSHRFGRQNCPALNATCHSCGKVGHWSPACRSGQKQASNLENDSQGESVSVNQVGAVECTESASDAPLVSSINTIEKLDLVEILFSTTTGRSVTVGCLPDTGANVNILPYLTACQKLGFEQSMIPNAPEMVDGSKLTLVGEYTVDLIFKEIHLKDVRFLISKGAKRPILSRKILKELKLIPKDFPFSQVDCTELPKRDVVLSNTSAAETKPELTNSNRITLGFGPELDEIANRYPKVFCGRVRPMKGPPAKIELTPDAQPCSTGAFRNIPEAYKEALKREIDAQVEAGILEPVDGPTEWLHPIVVVPKKGTDDVRLCVDLRRLNKYAKRPVNPQPTPWEMVCKIPKGAKYFALCDAFKGYHQVPLDEESRSLTTFYTPFGKFRYCSIPMGYAPAGDIFTDRIGRVVDKFVTARATEDCLIHAYSRTECLQKIEEFLKACDEGDITLNIKKFQFGEEVVFAGFLLNSEGYRINPALTDALRRFPQPVSQTDVRSFMGLANQICNFSDEISKLLIPLKDLLKRGQTFVWTADHQVAFEKAREELSKPRWLTYFDHKRPTRLYTDASRLNGLGFILKQLVDGEWKVVQAGSRFLKPAETRYAMIELELLAIVWAAKKTACFIEGTKFELITDHKPLIPILEHYALSQISNKRLQRLKMQIAHLQFEVNWVPGKDNVEADALSRYPTSHATSEDDVELDEDSDVPSVSAAEVLQGIEKTDEFETDLKDKLLLKLRETAKNDEEYCEVKEFVLKGFPPRESLKVSLDPYWRERDEFHIDKDGFLCHNNRLVIPKPLRSQYLDYLVFLHQGTDKMLQRARQSMWWPFMNVDIKKLAQVCRTCVERSASNPAEPLRTHDPVSYPFQALHLDLGNYAGKQWLIAIDQFSSWTVVKNMGKEATSEDICKVLLAIFADYGIPETIYSDGGPQFRDKTAFSEFCKRHNIESVLSSPYHSQSNGVAENAVKQMKRLIHCTYSGQLKTVDPEAWTKTITLFRNTPRQPTGLSPAELLFGRPIRDGLPTPRDHYKPTLKAEVEKRLQRVRELRNVNRGKNRNELSFLVPGQAVFIQHPTTKRWTEEGKVINVGKNNREYIVENSTGKWFVRNRRFLKPKLNQFPCQDPADVRHPTKPKVSPSTPKPVTPQGDVEIRRSSRTRSGPVRFEVDRDEAEAKRKNVERRGGRKKMNFKNF